MRETEPSPDSPGLSRRQFLLGGTLATTGGALFGWAGDAAAGVYHGAMPGASGAAAAPEAVLGSGYVFLNGAEAAFVEAAVARLIPADDLGPGALEAGCALFIDRQLAGPYGRAERWYMQGPWPEGDEQQGLQSRLSPAETYRAGIRAVNEHCRARFERKAFNELAEADQDRLLAQLEKGELDLQGVKAKAFFAVLLQNTVEGFFADPLYGGNRDLAGWKLIGFPGARYDHRDAVGRHGQRYDLPPVGIMGRKSWSAKA